MKIKNIIFDFDGVVIDTFDMLYDTFKTYSPNSSKDEYRTWFNGNILEKYSKLTKKQQEVRLESGKKVPGLYQKLKIDEEIISIIKDLSEKYTLYIISSSKEKNIINQLEKHNFKECFKEVLARETHVSKVKKFKLLENEGINNENSIFITDTLGDLIEANKVGIKSIAVTWGFHSKENLEKGRPWKIFSKYEDLKEF